MNRKYEAKVDVVVSIAKAATATTIDRDALRRN